MEYRHLLESEVAQLESQGCRAEDWGLVKVDPEFTPERFEDVTFSGPIRLGKYHRTFTNNAGIETPSGIYGARLHNCSVADDVLIHRVNNYIANYDIDSNSVIENIDTIAAKGNSSFGNGTMVNVLNEKGGRAIPIFDKLSAQMAYFLVFYRQRTKLLEQLTSFITKYTKDNTTNRGYIGSNVLIKNSREITNVKIGDFAEIRGTERLRNGSVNSSEEAPIIIGTAVIADDFIMNGNSSLIDGSIVNNCFIGEGAQISKQFSAEHSLFFANFIGHHGEAYGIFAGPHTATHHKSTLLISAYLSFMNAGSGSNQSNHTYKLGPIHQGILGRGSKTGSDSYVLWPAKIGDFTLVLGRHSSNCDTSELPYSFLLEGEGGTHVIPGVNFKSVGTIRDADKWPERDNRSSQSVDFINYDLLTPYTVGTIKKGKEILNNLQLESHYSERNYRFNGADIPRDSLEKGLHYYSLGYVKYLGNILMKQLSKNSFTSCDEMREQLLYSKDAGIDKWIDIAGMIVPIEKLEELLSSIENGEISELEELYSALELLHTSYTEWSWNWVASNIEEYVGKPLSEMSKEQLIDFINEWYSVTIKLDEYFIDDAGKEFARSSQVGFGMDGNDMDKIADFVAVRGSLMDNDFVQKIKKHMENKGKLFKAVKAKLQSIEGC